MALSPDHPLATKDAIDLLDLAPYPAALLNVEPASNLNEAMLRRFGVQPKIVYRSPNVHTIRAMVERNLVYSLLMEEVDESSGHLTLKYLPIAQETGSQLTACLVSAGCQGLGPDEGSYRVLSREPRED